MTLRLAVIGAGHLSSRRILPVIPTLDVEFCALCDLDADRAAKFGRRYGAAATYTDYRAMVEAAAPDAVIVCTGPEGHLAIGLDLLSRGLPVYTEKPPAADAAGAAALLAASRASGALCMTGFKKRFAPAYRAARRAIAAPGFGATTLVAIEQSAGLAYDPYSADPRRSFLLDFGIHAVDLARFLGGEVAEVDARDAGDSAYAIRLAYASGAVGSLALSAHHDWGVPGERAAVTGGPGEWLTVTGSVAFEQRRGGAVVAAQEPNFSTSSGDSLDETGFAGELRAFTDAVRGGPAPDSAIASAYRTMLLYEAIAQSARERRPIALEEVAP
jgi:predicted dehydrogenase